MMQNNLKLRHAVAFALGVLALGAQQQVQAFGLGDINVQSHLGEPFRAKIKVQGVSDLNKNGLSDNTCFKLADSTDDTMLSGMRFSLGPITNDEAILNLSTTQVVNNPILNLAILTECDNAIRRDYVVLLDPALSNQAETASNEATMSAAEATPAKAKKSAKKNQQLANFETAVSSVKQSKRAKKINENKALNTNGSNIVLHVPGGNSEGQGANTQAQVAEKNVVKSNQPRLSISSGDANAAMPLIGASLRLDRQLSVTPDPNAQPVAIDTDMQDEVTAMNNRLAHLSAQVAKLQSRNLTLEADNKVKTQQVLEAETSKNRMRWIGYVLGAALVFVSVQLARKLHWRREYEKLLENSDAPWTVAKEAVANAKPNEGKEDFFADSLRQDVDTDVDILTEEQANQSHTAAAEPMSIDESAQDLSILDHADVFLSHGRTSLAIQLLQNHLLEHPKQSVTIWLFLLDLLSKENMQELYEQTALDCKAHFNINISEFAKGDSSSGTNSLESFPRLAEGLQQVWGTPASIVYLDDLIYNNRLEPRAGLNKNLIEELLMLKTLAQENVNSAEVIHLDEKKLAMQEQKEAQLAAKKAQMLEKIDAPFLLEDIPEEEAEARRKRNEKVHEFGLLEWK